MNLREEKAGLTSLNWYAIIKGAAVALIIIFLGSIVTGIFFHVSVYSEKTLPLISNALFYASALFGGGFAAWFAGKKGLLHGVLTSILLVTVITIAASLFTSADLSLSETLQKAIISLLFGAVGGFLGVSLSK